MLILCRFLVRCQGSKRREISSFKSISISTIDVIAPLNDNKFLFYTLTSCMSFAESIPTHQLCNCFHTIEPIDSNSIYLEIEGSIKYWTYVQTLATWFGRDIAIEICCFLIISSDPTEVLRKFIDWRLNKEIISAADGMKIPYWRDISSASLYTALPLWYDDSRVIRLLIHRSNTNFEFQYKVDDGDGSFCRAVLTVLPSGLRICLYYRHYIPLMHSGQYGAFNHLSCQRDRQVRFNLGIWKINDMEDDFIQRTPANDIPQKYLERNNFYDERFGC